MTRHVDCPIQRYPHQARRTIGLWGGRYPSNAEICSAACATVGGRLPTMEELKSLSNAMFELSATRTPPGFASTRYWSSTVVPSSGTSHYSVDTSNGAINGYPVTSNLAVRCVR